MSGMASYTPGMEISGGSLGHGLTVAVGMALGLRHQGSASRVINFLSDGELDEGSTWEAAMGASHHQLGNLIAMVDINALQADGPTAGVLRTEPVADKWTACGWFAQRVDGNDVEALLAAFDDDRRTSDPIGRPVGHPVRHQGRPRGAAAGEPGEGALHAHRRRRVADLPRAADRRLRRSTRHDNRSATAHLGDDRLVRRPRPDAPPPRRSGTRWSQAAQADDRIVGLTADLGKYTDMHIFAQAFPDRYFQMGMAEQLLFGAAAGMAETGLVPFASTYSVFAARRAYDFICLDIAEPGLNVNIVGGLPGLTTGYGPSHQATEDIAIFRGIPGLTIVDPCDSVDIEQAVPQLAEHPGPTYLRLLRGHVPTVLDEYDYTFELGKAKVLRAGTDVVFVSSGLMTMRALLAAEELAAHHVDVAVVHTPTHQAVRRGNRAARGRYGPAGA